MEENRGHIAIGEADRAHLTRAAKWAKFIAIVQFVGIGLGILGCILMLLAGIVAGASMPEIYGMSEYSEFSDVSGATAGLTAGFLIWYSIFFLVMIAVSVFLALYLYNFANKTLQAVTYGNDAMMTEAFANLGRYFRLSGIMLIITFALVILMIIGVIIAASVAALGAF